jgi:DNA-binding NarL/FixJ family response regulator
MTTLNTYLVEDSALLQSSLIAALEEMAPVKFVGSAEDEASAVAWLEQHPRACDLLIVDLFLKGGSGLGVLRAAAADNGGSPTLKRIVLSNYATPDMRRRCLAMGAVRVFDKSSEIDELVCYCQGLARED